VHACAAYRITVQGVLDERWSDWLEGMSIASTVDAGASARTVLEGALADQSALVGVLGMLHGLGLPVINVEYLGRTIAPTSRSGQDNRAIDQKKES